MMRRILGGLALALTWAAVACADPADASRARAREILSRLIAVDTSLGRGNVPEVTAYLAEQFRRGGFAPKDVTELKLGDTGSLVVRYRGRATGKRPVDFLAHLDVVVARRSDWARDPFQLTEEDGYFFGRGTLDMKQEAALQAATFLRLRAEGYVPDRDLVLVFTGDEETSGGTAVDLLMNHRDLVDAEFALNGDGWGGVLDEKTGRPLIYFVQGAEKSSATYRLTVTNAGGHSSEPRPDNAIYQIADALKAIQGHVFPLEWNDWTLGAFRVAGQVTPGGLGAAMARFGADPHDLEAAEVIARDPAYAGRLRTTCVATMLEGGHAMNALPQSATATINCRIFPGTTAEDVAQVLAGLVGPNVQIRQAYEALRSQPSPLRQDVLDAVSKAVAAAHPGALVAPTQSSYATDGAFFRNAGIPTYGVSGVFTKTSEMFAHGLNERIRVEEFYAGLAHWYAMMKAVSGGG